MGRNHTSNNNLFTIHLTNVIKKYRKNIYFLVSLLQKSYLRYGKIDDYLSKKNTSNGVCNIILNFLSLIKNILRMNLNELGTRIPKFQNFKHSLLTYIKT